MQVEISAPDERHFCDAKKIGNEVVFTCPECGYVRVINELGETRVESNGDSLALHSGMSYPVGIDPEYPMS